jgi:hypothetical protein
LPSETHTALYQRLADITGRVTTALEENDTLALMGLTTEHRSAMSLLRQAGLSQEAGLLHPAEKMRDQVHEALEKITKQRDELCRQLVMFEKKKKVSAAYAGR